MNAIEIIILTTLTGVFTVCLLFFLAFFISGMSRYRSGSYSRNVRREE